MVRRRGTRRSASIEDGRCAGHLRPGPRATYRLEVGSPTWAAPEPPRAPPGRSSGWYWRCGTVCAPDTASMTRSAWTLVGGLPSTLVDPNRRRRPASPSGPDLVRDQRHQRHVISERAGRSRHRATVVPVIAVVLRPARNPGWAAQSSDGPGPPPRPECRRAATGVLANNLRCWSATVAKERCGQAATCRATNRQTLGGLAETSCSRTGQPNRAVWNASCTVHRACVVRCVAEVRHHPATTMLPRRSRHDDRSSTAPKSTPNQPQTVSGQYYSASGARSLRIATGHMNTRRIAGVSPPGAALVAPPPEQLIRKPGPRSGGNAIRHPGDRVDSMAWNSRRGDRRGDLERRGSDGRGQVALWRTRDERYAAFSHAFRSAHWTACWTGSAQCAGRRLWALSRSVVLTGRQVATTKELYIPELLERHNARLRVCADRFIGQSRWRLPSGLVDSIAASVMGNQRPSDHPGSTVVVFATAHLRDGSRSMESPTLRAGASRRVGPPVSAGQRASIALRAAAGRPA